MKQLLRYQDLIFLSAGILVLVVILGTLNPHLLSPLTPAASPPPPWTKPRAVLRGKAFAPSIPKTEFVYRENAQRDGVFIDGSLSLAIEKVWSTQQINFGIHGASKSSPAVDRTGVYVGSDSGWFYRFNLEGKPVWKFRVANSARGIHATALLDANYVYFGAYNGSFYCLQKESGELVWMTQLMDAVGSSAVADGDALYVSSERAGVLDGYLFKLERRSGRVLWSTVNFGEQVHSSPAIDQDGHVLVGANNGLLFAFRADSGVEIWRKNLGGAIKGTPLLHHGVAYVTSRKSELVALRIVDGEILWRVPLKGQAQSSPTLAPDAGLLIFGSHHPANLYGVYDPSLAPGATDKTVSEGSLRWTLDLAQPSPFDIMGSGIAIRSAPPESFKVWIGCGYNQICALDPPSGRILQKIDVAGPVSGVPAVFDGSLFVSVNEGPLTKLSTSLKR